VNPAPHPSSIPNRLSLGELVQQSTFLLMGVIGLLILVLALLILFHENINATKGYKLRTLERQRSEDLLRLEVMNMQIAQQQSLQNLQADPKIQAMIPVKKPTYVQGDQKVAAGDARP
jgi:hypothetical protein